MKKLKILIILIACILTVLTGYKIISTYALFESHLPSTAEIDVGKWNITVNQNDITSNTTHSFSIQNINITSNQNTKQGKFAPGMTGSFDIAIRPQDTQVSIRYDLLVDDSELDSSQINIASITETSHNKTLVRTGERTYTGIILLGDITANYNDNIHITFEWINNEANNDKDSEIGTVANSVIDVPIEINFTQYMGEAIVEYTEEI